ncbi:MAG: transporter, ATP-binding protein [Deltaproteobacteria bacterium]|nr:transporter, ATP-binding protein [Deltaproteobacteria bacterium]
MTDQPHRAEAASGSAPAVRIRNVTKTFGAQKALDDVSFDIPSGTVFGLLGPNGAGKTTLFSIMANFLKPASGSVEVLGINVNNIGDLQGRLSILPQDALFQANVPVREQLEFFALLSGMTKQAAADETTRVLTMVGLLDAQKKSARALSHGMTKRLGIAQAFMGSPEVIVLDEPTAGLDPVNAAAVRKLVADIKTKARATLIISSHNLAEIQEMCAAVAILNNGKLVEYKSIAELTQATGVVRMTFGRKLAELEWAQLRGLPGVGTVEVDTTNEYSIELILAAGQTSDLLIGTLVSSLAQAGLVPRSVKEGASLEEKFLEATSKKD